MHKLCIKQAWETNNYTGIWYITEDLVLLQWSWSADSPSAHTTRQTITNAAYRQYLTKTELL